MARLLAEQGQVGELWACADAGDANAVERLADHVRVHKNGYRARGGQGADVINGYRGRVVAIDGVLRVLVEWRAPRADGPRLERQWLDRGFIAAGGLGYGTAMTVAATQGATVDRALVYGYGLDPHSLYAAMSRDRDAAYLYLPRELLESDADRARLGEPEGHEVELQRVVAAYAATLSGDRANRLVTTEPSRSPVSTQDKCEMAKACVGPDRSWSTPSVRQRRPSAGPAFCWR
ncbi:hypothetical protein [Nonomuraea sp. NPDC005692]|uniref:hypothetical protein n=1 Tax=Nonomuraea sp. NPDC005692 TaxID=3157168 RepID=UPI0033D0C6D5